MHLLIFQIGCVMVFIAGVKLPILFTILHAALRLRNIKNKVKICNINNLQILMMQILFLNCKQ